MTIGNAERATSAIDGNGTQYVVAPASPPMYAPTGALQSAVYGKTTFAGITETRGYNNSLQLNGMSAASSAGTAINIALSDSVLGELLASRPNCADSLALPGEVTLPNPLDSYFVQHEDLATQQLQLPFAARLNSPNGQTCSHYFLKNL